MAKIKHTKNELKAQRDALRRFERYLPTLQLKKQQLQVEMRNIEVKIEENRAREAEARRRGCRPGSPCSRSRSISPPTCALAAVRDRHRQHRRGDIPVLEELEFEETRPDLFATPAWVDDGLSLLEGAAAPAAANGRSSRSSTGGWPTNCGSPASA